MKLQSAEDRSLARLVVWSVTFPSVLLVLGIYHGFVQVLYRSGLLRAESVMGLDYYQGLTLHGVVNAIVFTTFFIVGFGNAIVSYSLGKIPRLGVLWASFWLMTIGTVMAAVPILLGHATVLYTFYPPLRASPLFYLGATLLVIGSWLAFFAWIPVYLGWRRTHPGQATPLAVVGMFATFIVWLFATVPLAVDVLVLILPWSLGWVSTINVPLSRTLFWFFGHPLVYFWLLPVYVMFYTMLPRLGGGKLYSDHAGRLAFLLFIVFSAPVGLHHQYTEPGVDVSWKWLHALLTFGVAVPSFMTAFTLAASLEHGARLRGARGLFSWWARLPLFDSSNWMFAYFFVGLLLFYVGGITGLVNASVQMNNIVHNTSWIPAHFHTTVGGPVFLGFLAMTLHLVATLRGRAVRGRRWVLSVPWLWLAGLVLFSAPMSVNGIHGEPRRTNLGMTYLNPDSSLYQPQWVNLALVAAVGGILMTLAMLIWFACFFGTLLGRQTAEPELEFPQSEPLRHEPVGWLANFRPWIVVGLLLLALSYVPPLVGLSKTVFSGAPAYEPGSPVVLP